MYMSYDRYSNRPNARVAPLTGRRLSILHWARDVELARQWYYNIHRFNWRFQENGYPTPSFIIFTSKSTRQGGSSQQQKGIFPASTASLFLTSSQWQKTNNSKTIMWRLSEGAGTWLYALKTWAVNYLEYRYLTELQIIYGINVYKNYPYAKYELIWRRNAGRKNRAKKLSEGPS